MLGTPFTFIPRPFLLMPQSFFLPCDSTAKGFWSRLGLETSTRMKHDARYILNTTFGILQCKETLEFEVVYLQLV